MLCPSITFDSIVPLGLAGNLALGRQIQCAENFAQSLLTLCIQLTLSDCDSEDVPLRRCGSHEKSTVQGNSYMSCAFARIPAFSSTARQSQDSYYRSYHCAITPDLRGHVVMKVSAIMSSLKRINERFHSSHSVSKNYRAGRRICAWQVGRTPTAQPSPAKADLPQHSHLWPRRNLRRPLANAATLLSPY